MAVGSLLNKSEKTGRNYFFKDVFHLQTLKYLLPRQVLSFKAPFSIQHSLVRHGCVAIGTFSYRIAIEIFLSLNQNSKLRNRNKIPSVFIFREWFGTKLRISGCFSPLQNGLERNSELLLSSAEWLGMDF